MMFLLLSLIFFVKLHTILQSNSYFSVFSSNGVSSNDLTIFKIKNLTTRGQLLMLLLVVMIRLNLLLLIMSINLVLLLVVMIPIRI